jgi:hypothetical protein
LSNQATSKRWESQQKIVFFPGCFSQVALRGRKKGWKHVREKTGKKEVPE